MLRPTGRLLKEDGARFSTTRRRAAGGRPLAASDRRRAGTPGATVTMLSVEERPRELRWYHAGPMLFGDWGTSRLYVLGLAFAFLGRASFWFVLAMCGLMIAVGWSYTVVCRLFPDGGGVYSSAKQRSQLLAVVGGLLLCADYVVTASLSCLDAFHYLGVHELSFWGLRADVVLAAATILAIGG